MFLDRRTADARILKALLKARALRIGVTVCAIAGLLALSVLPVAHVHESSSGRTLVHSHIVDDAAEHAGTIDHDGHHGITTLDPTFVSERQYGVDHPLIAVAFVILAPERRLAGRVDPADAPVAHGPPIRAGSLRGPPA